MERITISISDDFAAELSDFMISRGYENRSEALRDLARSGLAQNQVSSGAAGECVATLSYVYNHHARELSRRLADVHHEQHDLNVATMHVHLDHTNCLEVAILRGPLGRLQALANQVTTEPKVSHVTLNAIPVEAKTAAHSHADGSPPHTHVTPRLGV